MAEQAERDVSYCGRLETKVTRVANVTRAPIPMNVTGISKLVSTIRADRGSDLRYETWTLAPTSGRALRYSDSATDTFRPFGVVKVKIRPYVTPSELTSRFTPVTVPVAEVPFSYGWCCRCA
nr:hypothetical protein [Streptomyces sp. WMMB 322]